MVLLAVRVVVVVLAVVVVLVVVVPHHCLGIYAGVNNNGNTGVCRVGIVKGMTETDVTDQTKSNRMFMMILSGVVITILQYTLLFMFLAVVFGLA